MANNGSVPPVDRFTGALLGGAIGDALGLPREGRHRTYFDAPHQLTDFVRRPGRISDDTQLTIQVAEYILAHGRLDPDDFARRLVLWLEYGVGKGQATVEAVVKLKAGVPWEQAGTYSAGNGSTMRSAPIGLAWWYDPARVYVEAMLSSRLTHTDPMALAGAVAMAAGTAWLVQREPSTWSPADFLAAIDGAIAGIETDPAAERRDERSRTTLRDRIALAGSLLDDPPHEVFARLYNGAFVLESLPSALYCFLRHRDQPAEVLYLAVDAGYDADTVAAMAGTLAGAARGLDALPAHLVEHVEQRDHLLDLGRRLHAFSLQRRPPAPPSNPTTP